MLIDSYARRFAYLRLSLTDACNFKCDYCLPNGYKCTVRKQFLKVDEIMNLVEGFAALGLEKIRLTGGEPTLRSDIVEIISRIKSKHPQIKVALTTNGFRLLTLLPKLAAAGLDAVNVSIDSLQQENFHRICGVDECENVKAAIDHAIALGIKTKLNAVLLRGLNDHEIGDFMSYIKDRDVTFRFIELMRTNENQQYFSKHHLSAAAVMAVIQESGWSRLERAATDGPAFNYAHADYKGRVGFIAPYSKDFCKSCNRLRISSLGGLRLCLFGDGDMDLRPYLQSATQLPELLQAITSSLKHKPAAHRLLENHSGNMSSFSTIGG